MKTEWHKGARQKLIRNVLAGLDIEMGIKRRVHEFSHEPLDLCNNVKRDFLKRKKRRTVFLARI